MAGTELGHQRAIDRVAPQRGAVGDALRAYEAATLDPDPRWADHLGDPLGRLQRAFADHVEFTEGPGGLFEEMLHGTGEVASEIDHLRRDHIVVAVAMERVAEALLRRPADDDHLRALAVSVTKLVSQHRRRGAQLLYDVYSVDVATGD